MSERIAAEGYSEDPLPEEEEEEMHWALERAGDLAIALVVTSLGVSLLGLLLLALDGVLWFGNLMPLGRGVIAAGSLGAMGSMSLATVVATLSGTFSPF